jgi:hypothetical protein
MPISKDDRHKAIDAIVDCPPELVGNVPGLFAKLKADFPSATDDELFECLEVAVDLLEERGAKHQREADALADLRPLFDGFPDGTPLGECARIKAEKGDPLALAFLEWEKAQAGGVQ